MKTTNTRPTDIIIITPLHLSEKETQEAYERAVFYLKEDMEFTDDEMDLLKGVDYYNKTCKFIKENVIDCDPETNIKTEVAAIGSLLMCVSAADIVYFTKGAMDDPDLAMLRDFAIRYKIEVGEEHSGSDDEIYKGSGKSKVVRSGTYRSYDWKIISVRGSHPCCYIRIPEDHPFFNMTYGDIESCCHDIGVDLDAHGGLTYAGDLDDGKYWIGWDYAHADDYVCVKGFKSTALGMGHKYTVDELTNDIYKVIDTIVDKIDTLKE